MVQKPNVRVLKGISAGWLTAGWLSVVCGLTNVAAAQAPGATEFDLQLSLPPASVARSLPESSVGGEELGGQHPEVMAIGMRRQNPSFQASHSLLRVGGSMAIVIGLLLGGVWLMRNMGAASVAGHPAETLRVLRRTKIAGRNYVNAIQFGDRLLLVGDGPTGLRTLAEVTDPHEVQELLTRLGGGSMARRPPGATRMNSTAGQYTPTEQELREWIQRDRLVRS